MSGKALLGLSGIAIAAVAQFIAFMLTGAGHGWITPFWFSLSLWLLLPLVLVRLRGRAISGAGSLLRNASLLPLALALDLALIVATFVEGSDQIISGPHYFMKVTAAGPMLVVTWIMLWLSWQVGALLLLFRKG
jgi:hypothetical protein